MLLALPILLASRWTRGSTLGHGNGMELAERIRRARRIAGLSQQGLAAAVGVTRSAVGNWEAACGACPTTKRLADLARVLHVNFEWLATGRGDMRLTPAADDTPAVDGCMVVDCPHERRLVLGYRKAPARIKAVLQELAGVHAPPPRAGREGLD